MDLNAVDQRFLDELAARLPQDVLRAPEPRHLEEPRGRFRGASRAVALPRTVDEVAEIVRAASEARVAIVPYGGGTGLVGGQVMGEGPAPLVLSLERMTAIRAVHPLENVMIAEAGAILADVQAAAGAADRLFPLSLAAEGSARIGGNLSTNAGGVNVLRYGNARDLCLGLEAVLPDGRIWNGLSRLRKDNTGYDLRNLLIGAEGTLGVITAASLKLFARSAEPGTALMVVPTPEAAIRLLPLARAQMGEAVSAFELISGVGLDFLSEALPDLRQPFADRPDWMVLIDVGLAAGQSAATALETLFEAALDEGLVLDGLVAQSEAQRQDFWSVREHIPEANKRIGAIASHDVSVPISAIPEFIEAGRARLASFDGLRINCFGHVGDGNLHYNIYPPKGGRREDHADQRSTITRVVHDLVAEFEGSISAEHGIGRLKVADLERYGDPVRLAAMRAIKQALDPKGIMNPGAVLAADRT